MNCLPTLSTRKFAIFFCSLALAGTASAATLLDEDFAYADGALNGTGGWTSTSGTANQLLVTSGRAVIDHGDSEDLERIIADTDSGILVASFDIIVTDNTPISGTNHQYFAHFRTTSNGNRGRVDVVPSVGNDFTLGIATTGNSAEAVLAAGFTYGNTVSLELSYDFATSIASLTVGAETISGLAGSAGQTLDAFALRQSDSTNDEVITLDNLVITTIPEASSTVLGLLGLLGVFIRRRR